ncbi:MAG: hypothetical protein IMZ60_04710 [Actinobacteria bacterium]|nr:hypothetical protein [Actinomycetota bacterium]
MKIQLYKDIEGNIETDRYFKERDIPKLKEFLTGLGYEVEDVTDFVPSFDKQLPFIDKPRVMKKTSREIDWHNPKVIFIVLNSKKTNDLILKEVIKESNIAVLAVMIKRGGIFQEYEKWKIENNKTEDNINRNNLQKEFSEIYAEQLKLSKQKRIPNGTKVFIQSQGVYGIIKKYDEKLGYEVKDEEGSQTIIGGFYKRKELLLEK